MGKHKKIERQKELDRKRRRREKSVKMRRRDLLKPKTPAHPAKKSK